MKNAIEKMTITQIKAAVQDDFGQHIDDSTAEDIREAATHGILLWTDKRLTIVGRHSLTLNIFRLWDHPTRGG